MLILEMENLYENCPIIVQVSHTCISIFCVILCYLCQSKPTSLWFICFSFYMIDSIVHTSWNSLSCICMDLRVFVLKLSYASVAFMLVFLVDDAYTVADKWLLKENLPLTYRQQVVEFILQNSGQNNFVPDSSFRDPYTGGKHVFFCATVTYFSVSCCCWQPSGFCIRQRICTWATVFIEWYVFNIDA